jgi:hypothetical protein
MFRPMIANFLRSILPALLLMIAGCAEREPAVIKPPKDAAAIIEPFLKALAAGNKDKAAAYVSPAALDELAVQFAADHKKLAAAPMLTPRFVDTDISQADGSSEGTEVNLVYAAKANGTWTSATVRVYRYRDEPFQVEYWRVTNKAPTPPLNSNIDPAKIADTEKMLGWIFAGLALLGSFGLIALIWVIKRRPQLVSPDGPIETRQSAATVRDAA